MARRHNQAEWKASLGKDQRTMHTAIEGALIVLTRIFRNDHRAIRPYLCVTHGTSSAEDALDVGVIQEMILRYRGHLLQTQEIGVAFLDDF